MNRLMIMLACVLCVICVQSTKAADPELEKLNPIDRAVIQKLLAIDPKLQWSRSSKERVTYVSFSRSAATTEAIALLPRLPSLSQLAVPVRDAESRDHSPVIMQPLGQCGSLRELDLGIAKHHTAADWKSLPVLRQVTKLRISDHAAGGIQMLDRFPKVMTVSISASNLERLNVDQFHQLTELEELTLRLLKSPWDGQGLTNLKACAKLEALVIGGEGLTDVALREIGTLTTLQSLTLISGKFTPEGFAALTDLNSFTCTEKWFNDDLAMGLKNCHKLKQLDVTNTEVNGACFKVLATLPLENIKASQIRLEYLHLLKECKTLSGLRLDAKTKTEIELQDRIWETIGQRAVLGRTWTGNKGDAPKSGK
ncbi:MAG: hypothetical protein JWP89_4230 [Schlesneria sp.]|nr:hypothetical protein [Schlesneria sp.]